MKIATHNVEFLFDVGEREHSGKKWNYTKEFVESRVTHFAQLFTELDADILLLQEVASKVVLQRILKKMNKKYQVYLAKPDKYGVGNATLFKSKECLCDSIPATTDLPVFSDGDKDTLGPRIWSRRDFVRVKTSYNGKPLYLLGIHIKSGFLMGLKNKNGVDYPMETQITKADGLIRSEFFRFAQARKARQVVDELLATNPQASVIVAGDFNSAEKYVPFRIIRGEIKTAPDALVSATQNIPETERFSVINKGKKLLIDHMLLSKNLVLNVKSSKILNTSLAEHTNVHPTPSFVESDHAPIVLELS